MTKHTPEFREQIAIHIEMLLDDEMRAHAYADKTHELEFQVFRVLGGYREALDSIKVKDARIAELEAHQEYQMREEGSLRDAIDRLKAELAALAEKMAQLERLRLALERIQKLGTSRTLPGRTFDGIKIPSKSFENEYAKIAREALAATEPRDLTKPRNYGSIEVEGAKSD